jgi:hypothetical protein
LSLLALNARQRLSAIKQQSDKDQTSDNDQSEWQTSEDVNITTSPTPGMLPSEHQHSQSAVSIHGQETVQPSDD